MNTKFNRYYKSRVELSLKIKWKEGLFNLPIYGKERSLLVLPTQRVYVLRKAVVSTNPHWSRVVGYDTFSLRVTHKEGLCSSSDDINNLMIIVLILK
jgi:hypothetical protein